MMEKDFREKALDLFVNEATRPLVTLEERIGNIESIEQGHWVEFETG